LRIFPCRGSRYRRPTRCCLHNPPSFFASQFKMRRYNLWMCVGNADPLYDEKICIGALWLSLYEAESMKKLTSAIMKLLWSTERNYKYGYGMSNFISGGWETVRSNRAIQHPINSRDLKSLVSSRISKLHVKNIAINPISHS